MKRIAALLLSLIFVVPTVCYGADDTKNSAETEQSEYMFDDCADFDKSLAHSDGLALDVVTEDNKYAFSGDDTHIIRLTDTEEWMVYETNPSGYFVFNTCFSPSEAISDFKFEYSVDNENWIGFNPQITQVSAESYKWKPIKYSLKKLPREAKYIKILFENIGGLPWSPCIESVELRPYSVNEQGFADCIDTKYYEPTKKLKSLGLISGYTKTEFRPDGELTRAEFCTMMAKLLNMNTLLNPSEYRPVFGDVNAEHWAAGAIYAMYGMGVINGDENKNFNPDDNIQFQDAVKIIVSVLGYAPIAQGEGGYPSGYMTAAGRLNLLDGLSSVDAVAAISRGDAAVLMNNSLDVEIMRQNVFGSQSVYETDDSTVLTEYHNIYEFSGEVTEAGCAGVYAVQTAADDEIIVGGERIKSGDLSGVDYLGMNVTVYARDNSDTFTALYAEINKLNNITEIDYNSYERIEGSSLFYTDESGREQRVSLTDDTKIIYNYKYDTRAALIDELEFNSGRLRVISNDGNQSAEYIMVYDYDTYFIENEGRLGGALTDKYAGAVNLGLDKADCIFLLNDGEEAEYSEDYTVPPGCVVCAAKSRDGQIADIRIIADTAVGMVESVAADGSECKIGGNVYKMSEYFKNSGHTIAPGDKTVTAYLDINNNIVYVSNSNLTEEYGYLQAVSNGDAFGGGIKLRIITETGKASEYEVTAKTALNGDMSGANRFAYLSPQQLIKFTLKSDGTLATVETAQDALDSVDNDNFSRCYTGENVKFYGDGLNIFSSKYQIGGETKVFFVPYDTTDITKYEVTGLSSLLTDTAYSVELFDMSAEYRAGAAVIRRATDDGTVYNYSPIGVVLNSGTAVNENGERYLSLKLYIDGMISELKFSPNGAADKTDGWLSGYTSRDTSGGKNLFSPGEVIQFSVKYDLCDAFRMLLTADEMNSDACFEKNLGDYGALSEDLFYSEMYTALGTVDRKFSDKILLCADKENGWIRSVPLGASNVYVYNRHTKTVSPGDNTDIEQGSRVFVYMRYATVPVMIAIRE